MKRVVVALIVLVGVINLNAKTTSLYEHARKLRMASQKELLSKIETKKPLVTKRVVEKIEKKYTKN